MLVNCMNFVNMAFKKDKILSSQFWKEFFKLLRSELQLNMAYHP